MSRVLLVNPPVHKEEMFSRGSEATASLIPPLGLAYIAAVLKRAGHECDILDGVATPVSLAELAARAERYDIVGFTVVTAYYLRVQEAIATMRATSRDCPVIMVGGPHVTARFGDLLEEGADYAVIGEGEITTLELVEALARGDNKAVRDIPGIAYLDEGGAVKRTPKRQLVTNLDEIPMPARDLLPMHLYRGTPARADAFPSHSMLTSRGCEGVCTFCSHKSFGNKVRSFSPERIVEEFFLLRDEYGANDIAVMDDNFTADADHVMKVCDMLIARGFDKSFSIESRVDSVNEAMLRKLKQAGCNYIAYGFESGSQRILDSIHKNETLEQMRETVALTKRVGLKIRGYFMFAYPGETLDEMGMTVDFAKELDIDVASFSLLVPFPGTTDYVRAKKAGTFDPDFYKKYILPEFNFPERPIFTPEGMTPQELLRFHKNAYTSYYMRPRIVLRRLLEIKTKGDVIALVQGAKTLIKNALS